MKEGDASMPSRRKHPQIFLDRLREPIGAASAIAGSDQPATTTISGVLDHTPGARIAHRATHETIVGFERNGCLALGPNAIALVDGDAVRGRPDSGPIVHIACSDDETPLTPGWVTNRAYVSLLDSRAPAPAAAQPRPTRQDRAVHSLLVDRATSMHADAVR